MYGFSVLTWYAALIVRVLYRLRFLAEQAPFDAATFSYAFPLLQKILSSGGVEATDEDHALEQVSLALSVIKFHSGECTCFSSYAGELF